MSVPVQSGQYPGGNGSPIYTFYANLGRTLPVIDGATAYGITGNGAIDDGPAVRAALTELYNAGGGKLVLPPGVVYMGQGANAENNTYLASGFIPGNVEVVGAGKNVTVLQLAAGSAQDSHVLMNWRIQSGTDQNIVIRDLTIDGNAANQSMPAGHGSMGLKTLRVQGLRCYNVRFLNVYGTANAGGGEGFHATFDLGTDALFLGCDAVATTANTATGFSANQSTNVKWLGCVGKGMGFGHGFTHNTCVGLVYDACTAILNGSYGFNSEAANDVVYQGCRSGGLAVNASSVPYTPGQSLGNTSHGFVMNNSMSLHYTACQSSYNGGTGLFQTGVAQGSGVSEWNGGELSHNGSYGYTGGFGDTMKFTGSPLITGNTGAQMHSGGVDHNAYGSLVAPAVPTSGTALTNPFSLPALVWVTGTVTNVSINGAQVAGAPGTFYLAPGATITLTYTGTPSWAWNSAL